MNKRALTALLLIVGMSTANANELNVEEVNTVKALQIMADMNNTSFLEAAMEVGTSLYDSCQLGDASACYASEDIAHVISHNQNISHW